MKKIILSTLLLVTLPVMAQHHGHGLRHHHWHGGHHNWIAPAVIGGVVTYALTRPAPQPIIIEQQPVVVQQGSTCTEWREIQTPDGKTYRERTCYQR